MYTCVRLNAESKSVKDRLIKYLADFELSYEPLDSLYVVLDSNDKWYATGGRSGNVLKGFAVLDDYRSEGFFDLILSSLVTESYKYGLDSLYVFTKREYSMIFKSFGFDELAHTKVSSLLMRSDYGVDKMLDELCIETVSDERVGAIVMNANPFTNGHRYLVEVAFSKVNKLLVFVVQNDASTFSFKDRFEMVKRGCTDFKNVQVIPSTDLIISQATFPSYFIKEKELISSEHAKIDAGVFKRFFVPRFNIGVRFLGSEPIDVSTAIYNEVLTNTLPPECEVEVVERLKSSDTVISASIVRRLLKEGRIEEITSYVPKTTYEYLKGIYQ